MVGGSRPLVAATKNSVELAKYELLGEVGHGGMATVYRARDRRLEREVAIKIIHRHLRENPEVERRFASEALAVAKVKHPNIVEVYDVSSEEEAERYLVVEFIEGLTLRQLLTERSPLPPEIAACITAEICRGLCQAHRHGVVHRDVKPENVLLSMRKDSSGEINVPRVKLTDFGIAKLLDAQGVTHTGQVLGSPAHMAPEQIEGGEVDARSDVFGAGVLFYEMLTGSLPFEGKNPAQVLRRVLDGSFVPAERQRPQVGAAYGRIVQKALSRAAEDRHATARQLGEELEEQLAALGIDEVRAEISRYLEDPDAYRQWHEEVIVDRIYERGNEARAEGDVVLAAGCFNRALAYRPDDTNLLSEVAGLARRNRFRRRLVRGLALAVLGVLVGAPIAFALYQSEREQAQLAKLEISSPELSFPAFVEDTDQQASTSADTKPLPEEPEQEMVPQPEEAAKRKKAPSLATPERPQAPDKRTVRTPVVGPQNARVRIDGKLVSWFQTHELTVGPHTFEFVPPNSECCEASPPRTVEIVPGEGHQVVRGVIRFRPATLKLSAPAGTRASCGIGVVLTAGASQKIPMNRPRRRLSCTISPPGDTGSEPKHVDVDLRPGRTFTLTGV